MLFACSEKTPPTQRHTYHPNLFTKRKSPSTFQPKPLQKHLACWPWKPTPPSDLPKTTRFITKSRGASRIPISGLLLPSLRATWQEEESCSSTSSSQGPQYPGFLASQSQQPACCPPPREMGPTDSSQGQEKTWPHRARLRKVPAHPPSPPGPPGDELHALNNLDPSSSPTSSPGFGKRTGDSPAASEEPSPSSQQEAQEATSQTTGVTAAPHRVMKDLGQSGRARGGGIIITSEAAAAQLPVHPSALAFG